MPACSRRSPLPGRRASLSGMREKVVVVTGASGGIGAALVRTVARRGARTVLVARREAELKEVAAGCVAESLCVPADVTRRAEVDRACAAALARFGRIDVWVNNAGRGITRPVSLLTDEDLDAMMAVNVKSALYGAQAVLPHFKARNAGQIVNVSSMLGRLSFAPQRSAYAAAKHALNALTTALRLELRSTHPGIHVTTVLPGVVATDFGLNALHGGTDSRAIPGGQSADEVAEVIADVIDRPRAEAYTRPEARQQVASYFAEEDVAVAEQRVPFVYPKR